MTERDNVDLNIDRLLTRNLEALKRISRQANRLEASCKQRKKKHKADLAARERKIARLESNLEKSKEKAAAANRSAAMDVTAKQAHTLNNECDTLRQKLSKLEAAREQDRAEVQQIMSSIRSVLETSQDA